jgi:uncharacterized protein
LVNSLAIVALGAAAGGFVQGLSGFAFGLVALGIWAWSLNPAAAGSLVVFGSLLGQTLSLGTVRQGLNAARLLPFIAGGILGFPSASFCSITSIRGASSWRSVSSW